MYKAAYLQNTDDVVVVITKKLSGWKILKTKLNIQNGG